MERTHINWTRGLERNRGRSFPSLRNMMISRGGENVEEKISTSSSPTAIKAVAIPLRWCSGQTPRI